MANKGLRKMRDEKVYDLQKENERHLNAFNMGSESGSPHFVPDE